MNLRIGSRDSKLAIAQAELVQKALQEQHPQWTLELITMKTTGDLILDRTLDQIGGKGLFVKELDNALLEHRVDLTVHSLKDLPMEESTNLPLLGVSEREDPRDVLILPNGVQSLDPKKPIGSASLRRQLQLKALFPDQQTVPVRGNVHTRLQKLDEGQFSALVLAYAGIKRLGLESRVNRIFSVEELLPAAGQGMLALQGRADFDHTLLEGITDDEAWIVAQAERSFVRTLQGGCSAPTAAYAVVFDQRITITGFYVGQNGLALKRSITGGVQDGVSLGAMLAVQIKEEADER